MPQNCVDIPDRICSTLSLESLVDSPGTSTMVKLEWPYHGAGAGLGAKDSYQVRNYKGLKNKCLKTFIQGIDRCCPASDMTGWDDLVRRLLKTPGKIVKNFLAMHNLHNHPGGISRQTFWSCISPQARPPFRRCL